jgi:putative DNA primase/helicase
LPFGIVLPSLRWYAGPGYVLVAGDGIVGVDLDKCRDPETGAVEPWAWDFVERLQTYTELSPSGRGLRLFAHGGLPPYGRRRDRVEIYDSARFLTVTGHRLDGTPDTLTDAPDELLTLHRELFGKPGAQVVGHMRGLRSPPPPLDDDELLSRAEWAGNGAKFMRLWRGDWQGRYPSQSEADAALCATLVFWTRDPEQIDRLFRRSGLLRGKWDRPWGISTYGEHTIARALALITVSWNPQL